VTRRSPKTRRRRDHSTRGEVSLLLSLLDQAFDQKAWHGPNLRGSIRGVSPEAAARRPGPGRHNIWEIALHCAYWKYAVRRLLTGESRGSFPLKGHNWFPRPGGQPGAAWRRDTALLAQEHRRLREVVKAVSPDRLSARPPGSRYSVSELIQGAASHDLYHAGQIRLLKRLAQR